jgi:hypothetical protein
MQAKLEAAVKAAEQFNAEAVETDERKRKYNAAGGGSANGDAEPTPGVNGLCQHAVPGWIQLAREARILHSPLSGLMPFVTAAEEMEAYRLKRARADDPLAAMGNSGSKGYDLV